MYWLRVVSLTVFGVALAAPLTAQGIPRGARVSQTVKSAPRLMVANPYVFQSSDSAAAVQVGEGMRKGMSSVVGRDFTVVERSQMNDALQQYGYPADAILTPLLATTLATNIQSRTVVTATMNRTPQGLHTVTARLAGVRDEAGNVVTVTQQQGQSLTDLGQKVAEALKPAVQSMDEAKACIDQSKQNPEKAIESARKALKELPNNGLASYCLAQIAIDRKAPREEIVQHLEAAVKGDPLSLPAWTALAVQRQQAGDTAGTILAFQRMLNVAPGNQKLREEAFRLFLNYGRPDAARQVADEGLKLDPSNTDLLDLRSNACLFLEDYKCAIQALEEIYAIDSTRADTLFFTKITLTAAQEPDTAALVKWAQIGARKYPQNVTILQQLNKAYALTGQVDSSIGVAQRLIALDSSNVTPALEAAKALIDNKRPKDAVPFLKVAAQNGDAQAKENTAALLYTAAAPLLQEPQDLVGAAELLRLAVANANPSGKVYPAANYLLGLATLFQVPQIDPQAEKQKSCDLAKQEEALLTEAETALTAGRSANPETVEKNLGIIKQYKPRVASMLKAYCK